MNAINQDPTSKPAPVFVISDEPVPWPVDVRVPVAGGEFQVQRFTALINVLSEAEHAGLAAPQIDDSATDLAEMLADNAQIFARHVAGWRDVFDAAGVLLPFDVDELHKLVTGRYGKAVSAGLWQAINEVRYGVRLGNSAPPPAAG